MTRHDRLIVLSIALLSSVFLFMWVNLESPLSEFGLNGLTESLGMGFTVLLLDRLIRRRDEARVLPQRRAAHEDVRLLVARIGSFWQMAFTESVPEPLPATLKQLLSKQVLTSIGHHLNLDAEPNVTPARTWRVYLAQELADFKRRAEVILERHNTVLEPSSYYAVHSLANSVMNADMLNALHHSDIQLGFPRPSNLGSSFFFLPEYFDAVIALVDWSNRESDYLHRMTGHEALRVQTNLVGPARDGLPRAMMDPRIREEQARTIAEHDPRTRP